MNLSAGSNRFKVDNRKLFEYLLISQPHEHPELLSALELISDLPATTLPPLFLFKILALFDLWMRLHLIPPNSAWM